MKISLIHNARLIAKECLYGVSAIALKKNKPLTTEESIHLSDFYLLSARFKELEDFLISIREHCNHGIKGTTPKYWNEFSVIDPEIAAEPYNPHDAILEACHNIERCILFHLDLIEFVRQVPSYEKRMKEYFDESYGPALVKVKPSGECQPISHEERIQDIQDTFLEGIEKTFEIEDFVFQIAEVKLVAVSYGDLNKILSIVKE